MSSWEFLIGEAILKQWVALRVPKEIVKLLLSLNSVTTTGIKAKDKI